MTIEEFIAARLAEDEAMARAATQGEWEQDDGGAVSVLKDWSSCEYYCRFPGDSRTSRGLQQTPNRHEHRLAEELVIAAVGHDDPEVLIADADVAHILRHDPARVLRQCAALRAMVTHVETMISPSQQIEAEYEVLCPIAAIWDKHPDYDPSWAADRGGSNP